MTQFVSVSHQFMTVPFMVSEGITASRVVTYATPWQPLCLMALTGVRDTDQQPVLVTAHEMPLSFFSWLVEVSKEALEELHLQKFATDFCIATGQRLYRNVVAGSNPPDFFIETDIAESRSVDCVQFAVQSRRQVYALFDKIRQTVFKQDPSKFDHLRGLLVYVYVEDLSLPLRREYQDSLIEGLLEFRFTAEMGVSAGMSLPVVAPDIGGVTIESGWRFHASPFIASAPSSPFFLRMGFDLSFVYTTQHLLNATWEEFDRLLKKHGKQEIDELLVTIGGPDRHGNVHPSERIIFDFMIQHDHLLNYQFNYLKRIFVHEWATGKIIKLYPEVQVVSPGNFAEFTASCVKIDGINLYVACSG